MDHHPSRPPVLTHSLVLHQNRLVDQVSRNWKADRIESAAQFWGDATLPLSEMRCCWIESPALPWSHDGTIHPLPGPLCVSVTQSNPGPVWTHLSANKLLFQIVMVSVVNTADWKMTPPPPPHTHTHTLLPLLLCCWWLPGLHLSPDSNLYWPSSSS